MSNEKNSTKKNPTIEKNTHTFKLKKSITLTAFVDEQGEFKEEAFNKANINLEKIITKALSSSETPLNFLIDDIEENNFIVEPEGLTPEELN